MNSDYACIALIDTMLNQPKRVLRFLRWLSQDSMSCTIVARQRNADAIHEMLDHADLSDAVSVHCVDDACTGTASQLLVVHELVTDHPTCLVTSDSSLCETQRLATFVDRLVWSSQDVHVVAATDVDDENLLNRPGVRSDVDGKLIELTTAVDCDFNYAGVAAFRNGFDAVAAIEGLLVREPELVNTLELVSVINELVHLHQTICTVDARGREVFSNGPTALVARPLASTT